MNVDKDLLASYCDALLGGIPLWLLGKWKDINIQYDYKIPKSRINSRIIIDDFELKILPPIGKIPSAAKLIHSNSIQWKVRSYPDSGAMFVALGNDRLYPKKYVELITYTTIQVQFDQRGIIIFE